MRFGDTALPVAPLVPYIRHRERLAGGRAYLAKKLVHRLGLTQAGCARLLDCRFETITLKTADKLCTALDLHIGLVWGMDFYNSLGGQEEEVDEEPVSVAS